MNTTDLLLVSTFVCVLQGCSSFPVETADSIALRESVLLRHDATFGRLSADDKVVWESNGEILLTPTTLFYVSGRRGHTLSFAQMTGVSVRDVARPWLLPGKKSLTDQLVVQIQRPNCDGGCVFNLRDEEASAQAARIIDEQRSQVDVFGHLRKGREVWISLGSRNAPYWWSSSPEYLLKNAPGKKKALDRRICELLDCSGSGSSGALYAAALETELTEAIETEYSFRNLRGVMVNRRTELDTRSLSMALSRVDPAVDSLLVSDLRSVMLRERVSADYQISIEVTFRAFVDYFNVRPLADGPYFWSNWSVTRPIDEWLQMSDDQFREQINGIARAVALQVQADLDIHHGGTNDASAH